MDWFETKCRTLRTNWIHLQTLDIQQIVVNPRHFLIRFSLLIILLTILSPLLIAQDEESQDLSNSVCFDCHADESLTKESNGKVISLYVNEKDLENSVHAGNDCISCHEDVTEIPHAESLKPAQCTACHADAVEVYAASSHGKSHAHGSANAPACSTCHGTHNILPKSDPSSKTHPLNQIQICTSCHLKPELASKFKFAAGDQIQDYSNGIHGRGVLKSGLLVSATCVNCHSAHDVRPRSDPQSKIYWSNVPELCGTCHLGILEQFRDSAHGVVWAAKSEKGPGCVTCHGAHGIQDPITIDFQLHIPQICAKCHEKEAPTYQDTFHGNAISLGFVRSATCASCHTSHRNLKADDPKSTVHPSNLMTTCGNCHKGITAGFITFDPHADPNDKERSPLLYYTYHGMAFLLLVVFGFFSIHTLLWLQRSIVGHFRGELKDHQEGNGPWIQRFSSSTRIVHIFVMISFLALAFTGLPIHFHYTQWARGLVGFLGGIETMRFFHRFFAVVTFGYASYHAIYLIKRIVLKRETKLLYGPVSMVPRWKDLQDLFHQLRWFLYLGKPAKLDRWTYWEKFDYFAVFWGVPVIGLSGLMLWFPSFFTQFLPGSVLNVAKIVHSEEALLAVGFIFVFHFFHTHLRPEAFPMDLVIFTGSIPLSRFKKERPEEYQRLQNEGTLEKYLVDPPTPQVLRWSYAIGTFGLSAGILMVIAILVSILKY